MRIAQSWPVAFSTACEQRNCQGPGFVVGKTMRLGIAGLTQESNTFALSFSTRSDFVIEEDDRVIASAHGTNTEVGGFIDALKSLAAEPIPLLSGWAVSAGPVEDATF